MRRRAWLLGVGALAFVPLHASAQHRLLQALAPGSNVEVHVARSLLAALPARIDDAALDVLRATHPDTMHALEETLRHALYA